MLGKPGECIGACRLAAQSVQICKAICFSDKIRGYATAFQWLGDKCMGHHQGTFADYIISMRFMAFHYR